MRRTMKRVVPKAYDRKRRKKRRRNASDVLSVRTSVSVFVRRVSRPGAELVLKKSSIANIDIAPHKFSLPFERVTRKSERSERATNTTRTNTKYFSWKRNISRSVYTQRIIQLNSSIPPLTRAHTKRTSFQPLNVTEF